MIIKLGLLILLPFMPILVLIDIVIGDAVTGTKTSVKDKITEHKNLYLKLWRK